MNRYRAVMAVVFVAAILPACSPASVSTQPAPYSVNLKPEDFVATVDNPYFPLLPGTTYVYETETGDGTERTEITVLDAPRVVAGIPATVVHDVVSLDGQLIEDTYDWYAQDELGNVWYLGEDVSNYEDGQFVDKAGSWESGVDGAMPGIIMFGDPADHIGETYRQEYYPGHAEDMAEILSVSETVTVPYGSFLDAVKTLDYTPLEPDLKEEKYYVSGIGPVKSVNLATGEQDVLVDYAAP